MGTGSKTFIFKQLILIWSAFSLSASAYAGGGMDSGGGDNRDITSGSAWFLGDRAIRYCVDLAPGFGVTPLQARRDIERAFDTWGEYIRRKQIFSENDHRRGYVVSVNYQYHESCDGIVDLVFHLGTTNAQVEEQKKHFENPTAIAHRESYDLDQAWSRGWIWFSPPGGVYPGARFPDWTLPERLHGMLLHEIGHVLGNSHVEGTIMERSLTHWMQFARDSERAKAVLTQIDDRKELFLCSDCPFDYEGVISHGLNPTDVGKMFERLMAREPRGKIRARLRYDRGTYRLEVQDEQARTELTAQLTDRGSQFELAGELFKVIRRKSERDIQGFNYGPSAGVSFARMTIQGKSETLLVERNPSYWSPLVVYLLENGRRVQLFTAGLKGMTDRP